MLTLKANITCTPHIAASPRRRRPPNEDLRTRLARCEELLARFSGSGGDIVVPLTDNASLPSPPGQAQRTAAPVSQPGLKGASHVIPPAFVQVKDERGTHVIDDYVLASLHEEVGAEFPRPLR